MKAVLPMLVLALSSCTPHSHHDDHGHAHGEVDERPRLSFTDWTADTELFFELPALVRNTGVPCAAHVTKLAGFEPLARGQVTVLVLDGAREERFVAGEASVPGIFRPVVRPTSSGKRKLVVEIEADGVSARHELGEVTVFESAAAARKHIPEEPEAPGRISFLKEQQWPIPFATEAAAERALSPILRVPGKLVTAPEGDLTIRAPVAGRVVSVEAGFPEVGREVAIGDALAVLAPRLEAADLASLELAIQKGRLELAYAESERKRLEQLREEGAVPERRVREATHTESAARAALGTAERRLAQFRRIETPSGRGQGSVPLLSPLRGLLEEVHAAPGAFVEAGAPLFRVVDPGQLRLEAQLAEADAAALDAVRGASFVVSDRAPVEVGRDALVARSHALDPRTRTLSVWFAVENVERTLPVGALAEVALHVGDPVPSLAVPVTALVDDAGVPVVFVQVEGESFERRVVRTGVRDRGYVAIERGLRAGERVVTRGAYAVKLAAASGQVPAHGHAH